MQPERGDDLGEEVRARRPVLGRDADRGLGEHEVGDHRAADAAGHLGRQVGDGVAPGQPTEGRVDEGDDRVEMRAGNRTEHQDDGEQPGGGRRRVLEQLEADVAGRQLLGGDPRPMTTAARNALPRNSASRRRQSGCVVHLSSGSSARSSAAGRSALGVERTTLASPHGGAARPSTVQPGLGRGVGEHGVDLPRRAVGVVHPHLVLHGVAARRRSSTSRSRGPRRPGGWSRPRTSSVVSTSTPRWLSAPVDPVGRAGRFSISTSFSGGSAMAKLA